MKRNKQFCECKEPLQANSKFRVCYYCHKVIKREVDWELITILVLGLIFFILLVLTDGPGRPLWNL